MLCIIFWKKWLRCEYYDVEKKLKRNNLLGRKKVKNIV